MSSPPLNPNGYPVSQWVLQGIQLVVDEMNRLGYIGTGAGTGALGNLQPAVQSLIDTASVSDRDRTTHTGFDPATNVNLRLPSTGATQDLQTYINNLEIRLTQLSASAPQNTVQPAAPSGTAAVDSVLTADNGTWPTAVSFKYIWYRFNTVTGQFTATGGIANTYKQVAADATFKMAVAVAAINAAGVQSGYVFSLLTAVVAVTLPSNTVAPTITEGSPQVVTTLLHANDGTWINTTGSTSLYRWTDNGAAIPGATAATYLTVTGQEGHVINVQVARQTVQGTSAYVPASNPVTMGGITALTFTAAPAFSIATLTLDVDNPINDATFTTTGSGTPVFVETDVYLNGSSVPYAPITVHPTVYNGHDDSYMTGNTIISNPPGLTTLVGATAVIRQVWQFNGINYTSPASTGKVVQGPSATFAVVPGASSYNFTVNSAITATTFAVATGGTRPYTYSIPAGQPTLPDGLHLNSDGTTTGTPTTIAGDTAYQIKVTDAVGATGTITVHIVISSASGVTWLASISAEQTFASMGQNYAQLLGGQRLLSSISETTGVTGSGTIVGPFGATNMRMGKMQNPANAAQKMIFLAAKLSDGETFNHLGRAELGLDAVAAAIAKSGVTYWLANEIYIPSTRIANGGRGSIFDIHNSYPVSTVTGPFEMGIQYQDVFPNTSPFLSFMQSNQSNPALSGYENLEYYPWTSDNPGFGATAATFNQGPQTWGAFPYNQMVKVTIRYRGDPVGNTGIFQVWLTVAGVTTQVVNLTNIRIGTNDAPAGYPLDYFKSGLDDLTGGGNGVWEGRRFVAIAQEQSGDTVAKYVAAYPQ